MTASSRIRKNNHKRSTTDVDPYPERYRKASDAAKAARDAARSRTGEADRGLGEEGVTVIQDATLQSVSLIRAAESVTGYVIEVGDNSVSLHPAGAHEEPSIVGLKDGTDYFLVPLGDYERGLYGDLEFKHATSKLNYGVVTEEALRPTGSPDAASVGDSGTSSVAGQSPSEPHAAQGWETATSTEVLDNIQGQVDRARLNYKNVHRVFYEAEINMVPTHVDTRLCYCDIRENHWVELGEI